MTAQPRGRGWERVTDADQDKVDAFIRRAGSVRRAMGILRVSETTMDSLRFGGRVQRLRMAEIRRLLAGLETT